MPVVNETIDGKRMVRIQGALNIWEAAAVWSSLYPLLQTPEPLEIDLAAVESCDGAGIQILWQIQRSLAERADDGRITCISEEVREALRLAGLDADCFPVGQGEAQ